MTAPVFVSHSSKDRSSVLALVSALEARGISCWVSSRDILGGDNYGDAIVDAIEHTPAMVLVFSAHANDSDEIKKEIALASQRRITVVPVRIEDVTPSKAFRYELATRNWIDVFPDWNEGIEKLAERIAAVIGSDLRLPEIEPPRPRKPATKNRGAVVAAGIAGIALVAAAAAFLVARQSQAPLSYATGTAAISSPAAAYKLPTDIAATETRSPPLQLAPAVIAPVKSSSSVAAAASASEIPTVLPPAAQVASAPAESEDAAARVPLSSAPPPATVANMVSEKPVTPVVAAPEPNPKISGVNDAPARLQLPSPTLATTVHPAIPAAASESSMAADSPPSRPATQVAAFVPPKASETTSPPHPSSNAIADGPPATAKGGEAFKECDECPEMVVAPAGKALLGSPPGEPGRDDQSEFDQHEVVFAKPFAIGRYDVTFAEWDACVADGGCGSRRPGDMDFGRGLRPVIFVSWNDAQSYLDWLKLKTHQTYRLPSEAEWEYAARGCARPDCEPKPFWFGAITPEDAVYNWQFSYRNSPKAFDARHQTEPVGRGNPNPFGLFNILGDVRQWTLDCWLLPPPAPYRDGAPSLKGDCSERVMRGGSWHDKPGALRAAARSWGSADDRTQPYVGFRVVRDMTL